MASSSFSLAPHPIARTQARADIPLSAGALITGVPALTTALLPSQKGNRCDACLRIMPHPRRCTGCAQYWYCSAQCQASQWRAHHRKVCKSLAKYVASTSYQALAEHEKLDAFLLSHLLACKGADAQGEAYKTFSELLPGPVTNVVPPPTCPPQSAQSDADALYLYARFANNNFAVHSHLSTIAHGIFPLASRSFNHSCLPNAAPRYVFVPETGQVRMEVVALRDIAPDEEICMPYLDPALLQSRTQIFQYTYGFECVCPSCVFLKRFQPPSALPPPAERTALEKSLRDFVFSPANSSSHEKSGTHPRAYDAYPLAYDTIPSKLYPFFTESYLTDLSASFSDASHDGVYSQALDAGITLLAVYLLIYPKNYPQIGMHLLEMAKTAWNAVVQGQGGELQEAENLQRALTWVAEAGEVLDIFGREGDEGGPLDEVYVLKGLLEEEAQRVRQ
ncbi:hypothetical protein PLICRDRAFT_139371 [Plicaturopsis crispa FD-325 SS-3]|nr:hypothetical protein PLICRDRAFT_139371 [Plicaturopsis crispa FD-325 SS-3]